MVAGSTGAVPAAAAGGDIAVDTPAGDTKDDARPGELDDPERLSRTVFVGNVAAAVKRKDLKKLFKAHGPIEAVRLRGVVAANPKLPKKTALLARRMHPNCDTLLAYVVYKPDGGSPCAEQPGEGARAEPQRPASGRAEDVAHPPVSRCVQAACAALNLTIFMDKHLRVNPAVHTRGPLRQSVFLGNLPFDVTEEELIVLFAAPAKTAGSALVGVRVTRDKETGMGRGVGFASFDDELGVRAVINMQGELKIRDRVIRMERAAKEKKRNTKTAKKIAKGEQRRMDRKQQLLDDAPSFYAARAEKRTAARAQGPTWRHAENSKGGDKQKDNGQGQARGEKGKTGCRCNWLRRCRQPFPLNLPWTARAAHYRPLLLNL
jgi:nucleolar protein 12